MYPVMIFSVCAGHFPFASPGFLPILFHSAPLRLTCVAASLDSLALWHTAGCSQWEAPAGGWRQVGEEARASPSSPSALPQVGCAPPTKAEVPTGGFSPPAPPSGSSNAPTLAPFRCITAPPPCCYIGGWEALLTTPASTLQILIVTLLAFLNFPSECVLLCFPLDPNL